jgi:hypothetical protein
MYLKGDFMNTSYTVLSTLALTSSVFAQQAAPAPSAWDLKWSFNETIEVHTFKNNGSTLVGLNQNLNVDINKQFHVNLDVPVYTQDNNTTISNINLGGSWDALTGKNDYIGEWDLSIGGGIYIPVGSEYFRNANVDPYLNAVFGCKIWELDFAQSAGYRFNGGDSYITWLGAKTDSDVLSFGTDLSYDWNAFKFGLEFDQFYYVNSGEKQLFLGPTVNWTVASNVDMNLGVAIPVYQEVVTPEANAVVTAGVGIKF